MIKIKIPGVNPGCCSGRTVTPAAQVLWGRALGPSSPPSPWAELGGARLVARAQGLGSCYTNYACSPPDPSAAHGLNSGGDLGSGSWGFGPGKHLPLTLRNVALPANLAAAGQLPAL